MNEITLTKHTYIPDHKIMDERVARVTAVLKRGEVEAKSAYAIASEVGLTPAAVRRVLTVLGGQLRYKTDPADTRGIWCGNPRRIYWM